VIKQFTDQGGVVVQGNVPETKPVTPDWTGTSVFSAPDPPKTPIDPNNPRDGWVKSPQDPNGNTWSHPEHGTLHNDLNHPPGKPGHWSWKDKWDNKWEYFPHDDKWRPKPGNKQRPQPNFKPGQFENEPWKPGLVTSVGTFFKDEWRRAEIRYQLEEMNELNVGPFASPNGKIPNPGIVPVGAGGSVKTVKLPVIRLAPGGDPF